MTPEEAKERFAAEWGIFNALGHLVVKEVSDQLRGELPSLQPINAFLRIPPSPRVKDPNSFVAKAFFRGMNFADPYKDVLDKVGVRFVVLLLEDTKIVGNAIKNSSIWSWEQSREFAEDRERYPTVFDYQSDHYIVRLQAPHVYEEVSIPAGTPCEIQVRTLMQHAYSEMSHDTVYKPSAVGDPLFGERWQEVWHCLKLLKMCFRGQQTL